MAAGQIVVLAGIIGVFATFAVILFWLSWGAGGPITLDDRKPARRGAQRQAELPADPSLAYDE